MRKLFHLLLASVMCVSVLAGCTSSPSSSAGSASGSQSEPDTAAEGSVVEVIGITEVCPAYHQITAVAIDYGQDVTAPGKDAYSVVDYDTADLKEDYDRRESSQAVVVNVYANHAPEKLDDPSQAPESGKYVIVELEPTHEVEFVGENAYGENESRRPTNVAGICTWRKDGEKSDHLRTDFSKFVVEQTQSVTSADGQTTFLQGQLPTIEFDKLINLELDDFVTTSIDSGRDYPINFSYYHPNPSDTNTKRPMIVFVTGGGGQLNFDENGTPISIAGNISREDVCIKWKQYDDDLIVLSQQLARSDSAPYAEQYDQVADSVELIQYFIDNFGADPDRIYCMGSSLGTLHWSLFLQEHADMMAAYIQCNGHFDGAQTMYTEEGDQNFVDYTDESLLADPDTYLPDARVALKSVMDNKMPIWIWHGVNDETAPVTRGVSTYEILRTLYKERGMSDEQIDQLVKLTLIEDEEFHDFGIVERHGASRIAAQHPEMMSWVLEHSRAANASI